MKKTAIVTGGTRGIGRAIVEKLLSDGYFVAFTYHSSNLLAEELVAKHGSDRTSAHALELTDKEATQDFVRSIQAKTSRIDLLVLNAGITQDGLFATLSEEDWFRVHQVNLLAPFHLLQAVSKIMIYQKSGSIVFVSSVAGAGGFAGQTNYASSKGAINSLSKTLSRELGRYGIRVNTISPGFIDTDMTKKVDRTHLRDMVQKIPLKKLGRPEDIANAVAFISSEGAAYIHGANLVIDGGLI